MNLRKQRLLLLMKDAQSAFSEKYLVLPIPGFASKKFIAYCAMKEDLELLLTFIELLKEKPQPTVQSALTISLISLYGKCFTDASKNSYPKLEPSDLFKNEEKFRVTHEILIDLRHQFIAHRGDTEKEIGIAFVIYPKGNTDEKSQMRFSQIRQTSFSDEEIEDIFDLIKYLIEKLIDKIQNAGQKLHEGFLKMFTVEELSMLIINNAK